MCSYNTVENLAVNMGWVSGMEIQSHVSKLPPAFGIIEIKTCQRIQNILFWLIFKTIKDGQFIKVDVDHKFIFFSWNLWLL